MLSTPPTCMRATMLASRITSSCSSSSKALKVAPFKLVKFQARAASILSTINDSPSRRSQQPEQALLLAEPSSSSRLNSTSATATTPSQPSTQPSSQIQTPALTWDRFLRLRAVRRNYNLVSSVLSALGTAGLGMTALSQQDFEKLSGMLFGLDPIMALGLLTLGSGAIGWLLGPFAGNWAFNMMHRRTAREMAVKEKEFYQHIKRYRCDPTGQSVNNPVPDYYGEKISSLKAYRQWLKDQRAFRKKRESY